MDTTTLIVGALTVATILFLAFHVSTRNKYDPNDISKDQLRVAFVRMAFNHDGRLVEEIMNLCLKNRNAHGLFQDYPLMGDCKRRNAFCEMCLEACATGGRGIVEVAMISQEFASMYRVVIASLPKEFQHFYRTTRSVSTLRLNENLFETDEPLVWTELHLPEGEKERKQKIHRLVQAFASRKIMFRFKSGPAIRAVPFTPHAEKQEEGSKK